MQDVIEGMAIAFSLLLIFGIMASFVVFMWVIGRKEKMIIEEYGKSQKYQDKEEDHE